MSRNRRIWVSSSITSTRGAGTLASIGVGLIVGGWLEQGQGDADQGTATVASGQRLHAAAMCADHALADGQAQAGAVAAAVAALDAVEHVEDARALVVGKAGAGIDHVDAQLAVQFARLHLHGGVGRRELGRVLHHVEHGLFDQRRVYPDRRPWGGGAGGRAGPEPISSSAPIQSRLIFRPSWPRRVMSSRFWM